jgi:ferrous iron transport protein A
MNATPSSKQHPYSSADPDQPTACLTLAALAPGQRARISGMCASADDADCLARLLEIGLIPGQEVYMIKRAPLGDPIELRVMNYNLCIRKREAAWILVEILV